MGIKLFRRVSQSCFPYNSLTPMLVKPLRIINFRQISCPNNGTSTIKKKKQQQQHYFLGVFSYGKMFISQHRLKNLWQSLTTFLVVYISLKMWNPEFYPRFQTGFDQCQGGDLYLLSTFLQMSMTSLASAAALSLMIPSKNLLYFYMKWLSRGFSLFSGFFVFSSLLKVDFCLYPY